MEIGEKIKKLRTAKLMTQSELAGGQITRNMLSCIENGSAQPSLGTVRYLAERLKVSPGYLLADAEDEEIYNKHNQIVNIKKAYLNGNHQICRDMCLRVDESMIDDEIELILSEVSLNLGIEHFDRGNLRDAGVFLDECIEHCAKTIYYTGHLVSVAGIYFRYMRLISATLGSNTVDEAELALAAGLHEEFCRYALLFERMEQDGDRDDAAVPDRGLRYLAESGPLRLHLQARIDMAEARYAEAYDILHRLLIEDQPIPEPVLYFVFCDLEICCKEIENYKGAYEYATDKIELLQKLLT